MSPYSPHRRKGTPTKVIWPKTYHAHYGTQACLQGNEVNTTNPRLDCRLAHAATGGHSYSNLPDSYISVYKPSAHYSNSTEVATVREREQ